MKQNEPDVFLSLAEDKRICDGWVDVKWLQNNCILSSEDRYCFLSKDFKQAHRLTRCRDDIIGVLRAHVLCTNYNGMVRYVANSRVQLYTRKTRLVVLSVDNFSQFAHLIQYDLVPFIHAIEDKYGITRTKFYLGFYCDRCGDKRPVVIVDGDSRWLHAPPLISLYILLIRIGLCYVKGQENDFMSIISKYYSSVYAFAPGNYLKIIDLLLRCNVKELFYCDRKENYKFPYLVECGVNTFCKYMNQQTGNYIISYWKRKASIMLNQN